MQPIFHAIRQNDLPAFLGLVEESESSLEERSEEQNTNNTVLHIAAKLGHRELVSKIIELRPSLLSSRNAYGDTPLHLAALLGDVNIVMQMLDTGLELCSARNNKNQTPLHLAFLSIFLEAAKLIVEKTNSVDIDELNFALSSGSSCKFIVSKLNFSLSCINSLAHYYCQVLLGLYWRDSQSWLGKMLGWLKAARNQRYCIMRVTKVTLN